MTAGLPFNGGHRPPLQFKTEARLRPRFFVCRPRQPAHHSTPTMAAKPKDAARYTELRNPKALRDFFIHDKFEAGVKLSGTEVKSIRAGKAQLADAFARIEKGEVWLYGAYIEEYSHGGLSQ